MYEIMADQSHGFTSKAGWMHFFDEYNQIVYEINQSSYALIKEDYTFDEWLEAYHGLSKRMKAEYRRSRDMAEPHINYYLDHPGRWTREVADPLLACLFRYVTRIQDISSLYRLGCSLMDFYTALNDPKALMKCHMILAFCYNFLDSIHMGDSVFSECSLALEYYEAHFPELTPEEQSMGLSIYDLLFDNLKNHISLDRPLKPVYIERLIKFYLASSKAAAYVRKTDRNYEFNQVIPSFDFYFVLSALCLEAKYFSPQDLQLIKSAAAAVTAEPLKDDKAREVRGIRNTVCMMMAGYLNGECSGVEILSYISQVMAVLPELVLNDHYDQDSIDAVESIYLSADSLVRQGYQADTLYRSVLKLYLTFMSTRPYILFLDHICNSCSYRYIINSLSSLDSGRELLISLLNLTIMRQIHTAVHSIMCGKLGKCIVSHIIERTPQLFAGQLSCASVEAVREQKEKFLEFIYEGALLHDIGKIMCSTVINTQYRRISDLEFNAIKYHPACGQTILKSLPELSIYQDLAAGHHKSFDGTKGYPADFHNPASPLRIFRDIMVICDSLDAATDLFGRSYAIPKNFETVLEEFKTGKNTVYRGDLVDLLDSDKELQEEIKTILIQGRGETHYEVHELIRGSGLKLESQDTGRWMYRLTESPS